jgi:SpoIID/LytB domain protein
MLIPNSIPDKEPILRVGIVLPEDNEIAIKLELSSSKNIRFNADGIIFDHSDNQEITIENGILNCCGSSFQNLVIEQDDTNSFIIVKDVIAGRGFHWAKKIDVKLTYSLIMSVVDNKIMLINELPIEEYLACVATSEMSAECPDSYIEAQTIVARSWMLANVEQKHVSLGFDVCNDDCCQRFQGVNNITAHSRKAAQSTKGTVLMHNNKIADARYSKSCGGIMEKFENLWENNPKEYMQNKSDAPEDFIVNLQNETDFKNWVAKTPEAFCSPHFIPEENLYRYLGNVDEEGKYFRWTVEVSNEDLVNNLNEKLKLYAKSVISLTPIKRAGSGRLLELEIKYLDQEDCTKSLIIYKDYEIRRLLHRKFLYSSAIIIESIYAENQQIPASFKYTGAGWGHGAGLCQIGGLGMALAGFSTEDIVYHYYPKTLLKKIY